LAHAKLAQESDPFSSYANTLFGFTCSFTGRHAEGVQASERAVELDSESYVARWFQHVALYVSGRFEEAVRAGESALTMSGRHPWAMATLAVTFADWGKPADAEALYAELASRARRSYVAPSLLAVAASAAGLEDEAIRHAREACQIRDPFSIGVFSRWWNPCNARLRAYPRFCELLAGTGLE
jgi:tetratricopeptide (TPR) repeat protein